jgi:tetratricopeptide (TPR) repeat protein
LTAAAGTDFYTRWAKWFFAPSATRTLSPCCPITLPQSVQRRIEEDTLESLREAVSLAPTNAVALARLGLATLAQSEAENPRRIEDSEGLLRQAMELAPLAPEVLRARVEWLDRTDKPAEALTFLNEALQQHADSPELWQAKGELLQKTNRLEDANLAFTQALALAGAETPLPVLRQQLLRQRSELLRRLKRPADALVDFRELVEAAYPTARQCRDQAWLNLFGSRAQQGLPEQTLLLAEKALRLDPKDWRDFRLLGMAQYRNGQFTAAAESLQAEGRLRHGRFSPHTLLYLALTYHKLGQLDQAGAYLRQAEKWWKTTFDRLEQSCEKRGAKAAAETAVRRRRYGETAWMVQIKDITQIEGVYAQLGLPTQAQLWGLRSEAERVLEMPMFKHKWKVVSVSFEVPWIVGRATGAIDENPVTLWHTCPREGEHVLPQEIVVDLGELLELTAFTYLPRPDESADGIVDQYEFYLSTDGHDWSEPAARGTFTNLKADRSLRTVPFARPVTARYFRFVGLHSVAANHLRVAEVGVVEK